MVLSVCVRVWGQGSPWQRVRKRVAVKRMAEMIASAGGGIEFWAGCISAERRGERLSDAHMRIQTHTPPLPSHFSIIRKPWGAHSKGWREDSGCTSCFRNHSFERQKFSSYTSVNWCKKLSGLSPHNLCFLWWSTARKSRYTKRNKYWWLSAGYKETSNVKEALEGRSVCLLS